MDEGKQLGRRLSFWNSAATEEEEDEEEEEEGGRGRRRRGRRREFLLISVPLQTSILWSGLNVRYVKT